MISKINNYNFLKTKSILFISKDVNTSKLLEKNFSDLIDRFSYQESISKSNFSMFDLLLIDTDFFDVDMIDNKLETVLSELNIPVIYICSNINDSLIEHIENIPLKNVILKGKQLNYILIYISLVLKKHGKVHFSNDYSFCMLKNIFYYKDKEIALSNLEQKFLRCLLKNKNNLVEYDKIIEEVWENNNCSIYSMRNVVNKIREKSYYNIIKNVSNRGYIVSDFKVY